MKGMIVLKKLPVYIIKHYLLLLAGLAVMAFGVAFSIKASLGTSPISSVPYVVSLFTSLTVGTATITMHCVFILLQILILRKNYHPIQLMQLPVAFFFGYLTDFGVWAVQGITCNTYWQQWIICLIGILLVSVGVSLEVKAGVVVLAGEGVVLAVCKVLPKVKFGYMKVGFDVTLVVIACISYASEQGMEAWGYDEDGWPSGFAGGEVQKAEPDTVITWIECRPCSEIQKDEELLTTFPGDKKAGDSGMMMVVLCKNPGYVDLLNPETTEQFIKLTHNKYKTGLPEKEFGLLGGFFTDEPQYKREKIPYSTIIEEEFEKEYGYSLRENLPALFRDFSGFTKVRYDYYRLVSRLFKENFTKKLYLWHRENSLGFTGHFLHEESLLRQMQGTAGVMPHYEYMTMPGMDWLGRSIGSPIVPKQVSSVAAQTGKKQVLSETFALCGWNVSFEELKWMAHWQFVNGVTMICQHLESYTLRGSRKRDYPPSLFYQ